jgi:hypothetical protein
MEVYWGLLYYIAEEGVNECANVQMCGCVDELI